MRWVRIAAGTTNSGLLGFVAWLAVGTRPAPSKVERQTQATRAHLAGIADQIRAFVGRRNRLPDTLAELKSPDSESPYEADPHDGFATPIDYRILDVATRTYRLRSCGPDKKPDTPDDLVWPAGERWR
jgi:hypothetical protein